MFNKQKELFSQLSPLKESVVTSNDRYMGLKSWDKVDKQTAQEFASMISKSKTDVAKIGAGNFGASISFNVRTPYAENYAPKLGKLIKNINDTTRKQINTVLTRGMEKGWSHEKVAKAISGKFDDMSYGRAMRIARTELCDAYEQGARQQAEDMMRLGLDLEKGWESGGPNVCEFCLQNSGDGVIGFNDYFSSGDSEPPLHPSCECTCVYHVNNDNDEKNFLQTVNDPANYNGVTIDPKTGLQAKHTDGYYFSTTNNVIKDTQNINWQNEQALIRQEVKNTVDSSYNNAYQKMYYGFWRDKNTVYFDASFHTDDLHFAMTEARFWGQKAIYDIKDGKVLNVEDYWKNYKTLQALKLGKRGEASILQMRNEFKDICASVGIKEKDRPLFNFESAFAPVRSPNGYSFKPGGMSNNSDKIDRISVYRYYGKDITTGKKYVEKTWRDVRPHEIVFGTSWAKVPQAQRLEAMYHELAHQYAGANAGHGRAWQELLTRWIGKDAFKKYETNYMTNLGQKIFIEALLESAGITDFYCVTIKGLRVFGIDKHIAKRLS